MDDESKEREGSYGTDPKIITMGEWNLLMKISRLNNIQITTMQMDIFNLSGEIYRLQEEIKRLKKKD